MKKYWSQITRLPVRKEIKGSPLGRINGVFVDAENGKVLAYLIGVLRVVAPTDIIKWTDNEMFVAEDDVLISPMDILRIETQGVKKTFFNGSKVQSISGAKYGTIRDFQLDLSTDSLLTFETSKSFFGFEWSKRQFSVKDIQEVTDKAIIVTPEPLKKAPSWRPLRFEA